MLQYKADYKYTSVIGDKKIKFKEWTAREERNYLSALEKEDISFSDKFIYDTLILPAIKDKDIVLSAIEQKKLLIDIRIKSISPDIEDTYKCPKCNKEHDIKVPIESIMKYIPQTFGDFDIENMKFTLGTLTSNKDKALLNLNEGVVNYVFNDFLIHIKSIEIDGEVHEDFKIKELRRFMDDLPTSIFDKLFEAYKDMSDDLELNYEWECSCGHSETLDYTNIPDLLWA